MRPLLAAMLAAFVLGVLAVLLLLPVIERWRAQPLPPPAPATSAPSAAAASAPITVDGLAARAAALDAQLSAVESRLALADQASRTAADNARRAERLLIAFSARRRIDRGLPLEQLEGLLRRDFGADRPQAVGAAIAGARTPTTLPDLREALDTLAPRLTAGSARDGVGRAIWRELSNLIVLRHDSSPSPRPNDRLARARRLLDAGQVEGALAEVARLPGAPEARTWMEAARRYIDTRAALDALESVAIDHPAPVPAAPLTPLVNPAGQLPGG